MMMFAAMLAHPLLTALGWALVHFIWQGAVAALLLAGLLKILRRRSSDARYAAACLTLLLLIISPLATFAIIDRSTSATTLESSPVSPLSAAPRQLVLATAGQEAGAPVWNSRPKSSGSNWRSGWSESLNRLFPWIMLGWLIGVTFFSLRLFGGWLYTQRLKKRGTRALDKRWQLVLQRLRWRLEVRRPVRILESAFIAAPMAIGWLRPVILIPTGALVGLTQGQLEAIIAHELAHIRRYDYLVNLLQAVVETLLFYHPAVWWVSRQIRIEREHCCDDLAVAACGNVLTYARALMEMEQLRAAGPQLAVAANGGLLMNRIHRLVGVQATPTSRLTGLFAGLIVMMTVISLAVGAQILPSFTAPGVDQIDNANEKAERQVAKSMIVEPLKKIEPLSQSLQDADEQMRKKAVEALTILKKIAVESSRDGHQQLLQNRSTNEAAPNVNRQTNDNLTALNSSNPNERAAAACALGKAGAVEAIPALINLLGDETPVQGGKCWGSGEWGPALHVFKQASPGEQAALALASFGQKAVEPLIGALSSGQAGARRNAAWALGEVRGGLSTNRSAAVEPLMGALGDSDPWVRTAAAFSLGEMRPRQAVEPLIAALTDSQSEVRVMAARALGEMKVQRGVDSLSVVLLRDEDPRVRRQAAWALGEIADPQSFDTLIAALKDQDQGVRSSVKHAISEIKD